MKVLVGTFNKEKALVALIVPTLGTVKIRKDSLTALITSFTAIPSADPSQGQEAGHVPA